MNKDKIKPQNFYKIARIMRDFETKNIGIRLAAFGSEIAECASEISQEHGRLIRANSNIMQEIRVSSRNDPFKTMEQQEADMSGFMPEIQGSSFLRVVLRVFENLDDIWSSLNVLIENARPDELYISDYNRSPLVTNADQRHLQLMEMDWNMTSVCTFVECMKYVADIQFGLFKAIENIVLTMEKFYEFVHHRHSIEGMKVFRDPIVTDVALSVFENIDAHGEIAGGKKPEEVSSYTEGKALAIAATVKGGKLYSIIQQPESFQDFIQRNIGKLRSFANDIQHALRDITHEVCTATNYKSKERVTEADWKALIQRVQDANVASIVDKSEEKLLSPQERFAAKFRDETLDTLTKQIIDPAVSVKALVQYVLKRKAEMRNYNENENSFYTCRISAGNPFMGQAPGALEVIPSEKPSVKLENIIGTGFDDVKEFVKGTDGAVKWHDLFLATSPRKKVDRQHLLMVGPMGCHRKGQKILMFNGLLKSVEEIKVGDRLMGPDSLPRTVLKLHHGFDDMVEIIPNKGESWVVNKAHILTLVRTSRQIGSHNGNPKKYWAVNEVKDVAVSDYINWSSTQKNIHKLFRTGVEFELIEEPLPLEPYFLGIILGDGCIIDRVGITNTAEEVIQEVYKQAYNFGLHVSVDAGGTSSATYHASGVCKKLNPITSMLRDLHLDGCDSGEKFIPHQYKVASRKDRFEILAGLIDTDGHLHKNCIDYISKSERLANDVVFITRSLGLAAYISTCSKKSQNGTWGTYFRVSISGDTDQIPTRILYKQAGKRKQVKNVLRTGFKVRELPSEEFFGFTTDADHRYLLGDFTVTHNCGKTEAMRAVANFEGSVAIFAQGSDFLTCWKGEDLKNPKRLFQQALKIQKDTKKHVYLMIDEIDSVLNSDRGPTDTNLSLEFQILMDGMVSYPHISVWGATNNLARIPMPMVRRFKVLIVGELSPLHRKSLLQYYMGYLPHSITDEEFTAAATKLEGCTGDIIAKISESLWREKMVQFVSDDKKSATEMTDFLNEESQFNIREFDEKVRHNFLQRLRKHILVTARDLNETIDTALTSIGVRSEIETAVNTYKAAKLLVAAMQKEEQGKEKSMILKPW